MKKLIAIFSVLAITGNACAQGAGKVSLQDLHITTKANPSTNKEGQGQLILPNAQAGSVHVHDITVTKATPSTAKIGEGKIILSGSNMKEGANTLTKAGVGTLEIMKQGNTAYRVIFIDEAGNPTTLKPEPGSTNIIPNGKWQINANAKTKLYRFFGDSN